jgi:hypothetical protein
MAACYLKARGPRKDGGLLSGWAMRLFRRRSLEEVREIAFEIEMRGQHGRDINDPRETHVPRAARRGGRSRRWSLVCIMYARLAEDRFGDGYRVDLGEEWGMAVAEIRIIMVAFRQSSYQHSSAKLYPKVKEHITPIENKFVK